ncbi:MAG: hypothetical protein LW693_03310 [Saprospiraceae bacterium]|nr:hypothetical protein [Saprospiraceae bacterium]
MESIIQQFLHFDRLVNISPVGDGNINDTWRTTVENQGNTQSFILQRINHRIFRDPAAVMQNIERVTSHIAGSDFPYSSPAPVHTLIWTIPAYLKVRLQKIQPMKPHARMALSRAHWAISPLRSCRKQFPGFTTPIGAGTRFWKL